MNRFGQISAIMATALACACTPKVSDEISAVRHSIFKINVVSQESKPLSPWDGFSTSSSSGTGFYIGENRILTNAHVVASSKYITVRRDGDANSEPAFVTYIAHDCDLAILTVKDPAYFQKMVPLQFGALPKLRSPVAAVGYPLGGEQISITEGVVSRVDSRRYSHTGADEHLLVQVDSAINPGNSGGPVLQYDKVVGVAFQGNASAQNTGYIIPTLIVERFLKDIEDKTYDGHPELDFIFMSEVLENPGTSKFHGLAKKAVGIKIAFVPEYTPLAETLRQGDVILAVDGAQVGVDGQVTFNGERVDFRVLPDLRQIGDEIEFLIFRDGKEQKVKIKLNATIEHPTEGRSYAKKPKYLVYAGLIFTSLSQNYLKTWGSKWYEDAPSILRYIHYYWRFEPEFSKAKEIVVYSGRLPHHVNTYAESQKHAVVTKVNGQAIASLEDVESALKKSGGEFQVVEFFENVEPIVLPRAEADGVDAAISKRYNVNPTSWMFNAKVDGAVRLGDSL